MENARVLPHAGRWFTEGEPMSTTQPSVERSIGELPPIDGPIAEYDQYDQPTGYGYFRCSGCGVEAMAEGTVAAHCECR